MPEIADDIPPGKPARKPRKLLRGFIEPYTPAEQRRRYKARRKAKGLRTPGGKTRPMFARGNFVAVDGEGFAEGAELVRRVPSSGAEYRGRAHHYALLAASDGSEIYAPEGRLSAGDCLDFLLEIKINDPLAILVCFASPYDVTQMLAYDLPREKIAELMAPAEIGQTARTHVILGRYEYRLEYRPRKVLAIWRWPRGVPHYATVKGKRRMVNCVSVKLWDVWGFFQSSFKAVMQKWIPDHPDYPLIAKLKDERPDFNRADIELIRRYNEAELRCLVAIMDRVRDAVSANGLVLSQWHGAGAIASAMNKANAVKDHKAPTPPAVFDACRAAFSGGHIEICKIGRHMGTVFHYDINSAYPAQFAKLPSLAGGVWTHGTGKPPAGFTMVKVEFDFADGRPFYPLFYREKGGRIIYPQRGTGWYWMAEYEAARVFARRFGAHVFRVLEWRHMTPADPHARPFAWIEGYYQRRKKLMDADPKSGEGEILKFGYNACYGKVLQQVGARFGDDGEIIPPTYFQLEWAGFITAGCRAQMMMAAMRKPDAIIGFSTDGLFSTEDLGLRVPKDKVLGAWHRETHDGMTMVMPGFYWLHDGDKDTLQSRGFDKDQMTGADIIWRAWRRGETKIRLRLKRLIGLGSCLTSDVFWDMRGMFTVTHKQLALNGDNSKRHPAMLYRVKPHMGLVDTTPRQQDDNLLSPLEDLQSALYEIEWMAKETNADVETWRDIEAAALA